MVGPKNKDDVFIPNALYSNHLRSESMRRDAMRRKGCLDATTVSPRASRPIAVNAEHQQP